MALVGLHTEKEQPLS